MSHESTVRSWTLEEWERLCEHPSPFVRLWVAKAARNYLDRKSRSALLPRLLQEEEPQICYHAETDLLNTPFPELGEWYLLIALRHTSEWVQVSSALRTLAAIGDADRLSSWLDEIRVELATPGQEKEFFLEQLFLLPEYLALLPLDAAGPVAEKAHEILLERKLEEEDLAEGRAEDISHALAGLLLSHPRPREVLDFLGQLDISQEMSESLAEVMGDSDWAISFLEDRDDSEEPDDTPDWDIWDDLEEDEEDELFEDEDEDDLFSKEAYDEDDIEGMDDEWDLDEEEGGLAGLNLDFLQKYLPADFLSDWEDCPLQGPRLCLQHAARLMRGSPSRTGEAEGLPGWTSHDFSRLERAYALLEILAYPDLLTASRPDDFEECAVLLLVLISAGRTCIGRSVEDFSREEMLSLISRDRPNMLLDRAFSTFLDSGAKDADPSFREILLERARAALSDFGSAWTKRVLSLGPVYGLEELIPGIVHIFHGDTDELNDEDLTFLENTIIAFGSSRIWEEHRKQSGERENSPYFLEEMRTWQLFLIQKAPCPEALEWLRVNLYTLIQQDEVETLETVCDTGDPRFISELQPLLAEDEDSRGEVFQTLCRLHGDDRAFGPEKEDLLWDTSRGRHQKMLEKAQFILRGIPRPSSSQRERVQLRCDNCGGVFHNQPERIVIYPQRHADGNVEIDIGGELGCKSCGAAVDRLRVTAFGRQQIADSAFPSLSQLDMEADTEVLTGNRDSTKQVLVWPKNMTALGEPVATIGEGLGQYEHHLASDPEDPGLCVGKANLLTRLLRLGEARAYYLRALENDPYCLDALQGMYSICSRQGREDEAWDWLQQAYSQLSRGSVVRANPNDLKREISQFYSREASRLGMAPEQPLKSRKHRVKRNDPCPCGSGKKYKKCCLEK